MPDNNPEPLVSNNPKACHGVSDRRTRLVGTTNYCILSLHRQQSSIVHKTMAPECLKF